MRKIYFLPLIFLAVFVFLSLSLVVAKPTYAYDCAPDENAIICWAKKVGSDNFSKFASQNVIWIINSLIQNLSGVDVSGQIAYEPSADVTAFLGKTVTGLAFSPPPMHAKDFFVNKALTDNLLVPKSSLASGADIIKGGGPGNPEWLLDIWKLLRNLSYSIIIVIIVFTGLLIMLNYRTDPRTTLSLMDFIPKLTIGLILITFSWVLSGLFVDLTTVLVFAAKNLFFPGGFGDVTQFIGFSVAAVIILGGLGFAAFSTGVGAVVGVAGMAVAVVFLILLVAYIIGAIAAVVSLTKRWVAMVLLAVFSPIIFLWGMVPNQEEAVQSWFKSMLVSALTFPAAGVVLFIASTLVPTVPLKSFPPPPAEYPWVGGNTIFLLISPLVSVMLLFITASIPSVLEEYVDVKAPRALGDVGKQVGKMVAALPFIGGAMK